jgi:hypothetical protein
LHRVAHQVLGPSHPSVAEILSRLALVHADHGAAGEATEQGMQALRIATKHYQPDHPEYLTFVGHYGVVLSKQVRRRAASLGSGASPTQVFRTAFRNFRLEPRL